MAKMLQREFFERDTVEVARDLIGCFLVRKIENDTRRFMITETEAYDGPFDLASHSSKGRTPRTEVMFGAAGTLYVYFVYGMHNMLNIVTGAHGFPAAVLIRGIEGTSGPGRLTKALGITRDLNALPLGKKSGLWIEEGKKIDTTNIMRTPRIGVNYAGPIWSQKLYRFVFTEDNQINK
jgi:DNA-3-methyladenine glycosylase